MFLRQTPLFSNKIASKTGILTSLVTASRLSQASYALLLCSSDFRFAYLARFYNIDYDLILKANNIE